jgi:iron complex outermembrane receptor protein
MGANMSDEWKIKKGSLTKVLLAAALSTQVLTAWAQDDAQEGEEGEEAADLGRVVVTGSLIKREDFESTSPMQVITAETQFQAGQLSVADILQGSTVAAGTTQINNQFNGFIVQGGTGTQTLDLRGLGPQRNLVVLNGRRIGPSGTRGQVSSLDLATIPEIAVNRFEIVLDGSSSIYGSDAVAGVTNIITRRSVDETEFQALAEVPFDSGGEQYRAAFVTGLNWDSGAATISAQWSKREALRVGDRDFLQCTEDLITDGSGNRIDREDRSAIDDSLRGCNFLYANTVLDLFTGARYVPSPDGVTDGPFPGYRPRANGRYDDANGEAFYEDILNFDFALSEMAFNEQERLNIYATFDQSFDFWGGVDWDADLLYSNRETTAENWRQFFPFVSSSDFIPYPDDPDYNPGLAASLPVMPYPSNTNVDVSYTYFTTGLSGILPTSNFWSWQVYAAYTLSDGDYTRNSILASRSGDINFDTSAPRIDYFSPGVLSGQDMQLLIDTVGINQTGNTEYEQLQTVGILSGDLFELPAGTLGAAFGLEYRDFSIDDQPSQASRDGDLWGESSALVTQGDNNVWEVFGEFDIPLLANKFLVEDLTLNVSARAFDYDFGGSDTVWKAGLRWQIVPSFALRGTAGTSYRAPGLFEQFLGDQTGFVGQLAIDSCVNWGESTNDFLRRNCEADGLPPDWIGGGSSATVISGGGGDSLKPETSDSFTVGFVWSPEFTNLNVAVDYFEIEVNDQIAQLGPAAIVAGCYTAENFPNSFCDLFDRVPESDPNFPNQINTVLDQFVNINEQKVSGIDLVATWSSDYDWGTLDLEASTTWQQENVFRLFDADAVEGFDDTDVVGRIGNPEFVTNFRATARKNDWSVTYFLQFASETDNSDIAAEEFTYFGFQGAQRDITMDALYLHNVSFFYQQDKWDVLIGINNLLDDEPDTVSTGAGAARRGNIPIAASQYDMFGRRIFGRVNFRF